MLLRWIVVGLLAALAAAAIWRFGAADALRQAREPAAPAPAPFRFDNDEPRRPAASGVTAGTAAPSAGTGLRAGGGPRKCRRGSSVVYTDGTCPPGSQEVALGAGSVTVVRGQPAAHAAAASLPNARELLVGPDDGSLRDKRMERILNP